jgi:hypothetical protein
MLQPAAIPANPIAFPGHMGSTQSTPGRCLGAAAPHQMMGFEDEGTGIRKGRPGPTCVVAQTKAGAKQ